MSISQNLGEVAASRSIFPYWKHGAATRGRRRTKEYRAWCDAKTRCHNPKSTSYRFYGARGITVCPEWRHDFARFLADVGPCPLGMTLDRIDSDRHYEPGNCRWATPLEQGRNMRSNRWITFGGETLCVTAWAERLGIPGSTLSARLTRLGWSEQRALSEPLRLPGRKIAVCHPDRRHLARGMCSACYDRWFRGGQRHDN